MKTLIKILCLSMLWFSCEESSSNKENSQSNKPNSEFNKENNQSNKLNNESNKENSGFKFRCLTLYTKENNVCWWACADGEITSYKLVGDTTLIIDFYTDPYDGEDAVFDLLFNLVGCFRKRQESYYNVNIKNIIINYGCMKNTQETVIIDKYSDESNDLWEYTPMGTFSPDLDEVEKYEDVFAYRKHFSTNTKKTIEKEYGNCHGQFRHQYNSGLKDKFKKFKGTDLEEN